MNKHFFWNRNLAAVDGNTCRNHDNTASLGQHLHIQFDDILPDGIDQCQIRILFPGTVADGFHQCLFHFVQEETLVFFQRTYTVIDRQFPGTAGHDQIHTLQIAGLVLFRKCVCCHIQTFFRQEKLCFRNRSGGNFVRFHVGQHKLAACTRCNMHPFQMMFAASITMSFHRQRIAYLTGLYFIFFGSIVKIFVEINKEIADVGRFQNGREFAVDIVRHICPEYTFIFRKTGAVNFPLLERCCQFQLDF